MPSLFSHSSLHSIKRASCPCPDHQPAINMINMRVGVMWYRASHARRLWQTEHTAGGTQEGKNETASRGGGAGAEEAKLRGRGAWGQAADSSIARCTRPSAVRHSTQ